MKELEYYMSVVTSQKNTQIALPSSVLLNQWHTTRMNLAKNNDISMILANENARGITVLQHSYKKTQNQLNYYVSLKFLNQKYLTQNFPKVN